MSATYLDRQKVEAAYVAYSTVFDMKLKNTPVVYPQLATVIPGVSERLEFKWFGSSPLMKKWLGDRTLQRLRGETMALTTEWFANGLEIDVDDFKSDAKLGLLAARIRTLAAAAARLLDERVVTYYTTGFAATNGLCYDGQYLIDSDHTASGSGGVAQSNLIAGALSSTTFNNALQRGMEFKDDVGEPIGVDMRLLTVGPSNQLTVRQILRQENKAGGETNLDLGQAASIITPRITDTKWFLTTTDEIKGVILGIEVEPQFASADDPGASEMFMRRTALYGAHTKFGLCYGLWQAVIGSLG